MNKTRNGKNIFLGRRSRVAYLYYGPNADCGCAVGSYVQPALDDWVSIGTLLADQYMESIKITKITSLGTAGTYKFGLRMRGTTANEGGAPEILEFLKPVTASADVTTETEALVIAPALATLDTTKQETNFKTRTVGEMVEWLKTVKSEYFPDRLSKVAKYGAFDLCVQLSGGTMATNIEIEAMYRYSIC